MSEVVAAVLFFMIPIVAILTYHQRKMAEIMHARVPHNPAQIDELRREMQQLKEIVAQQAIQMDDFLASQRRLAASPPPIENQLR